MIEINNNNEFKITKANKTIKDEKKKTRERERENRREIQETNEQDREKGGGGLESSKARRTSQRKRTYKEKQRADQTGKQTNGYRPTGSRSLRWSEEQQDRGVLFY